MPEITNKVFISIGVSRPEGGLDELPGAINAAERMAAWATAQGYLTVLIHDRKHQEVTVNLLREEIASAIKQIVSKTELKRMVIFFAGHGAALAVGDQYWILTNWKKRPTEAIKVSSLQRMLEYYGPRQVAIFGDACQEFSAKFIDLVGSPLLDMPDEEQHPYELDQFFAVDVGKQAFMIKADGDNQDFCLFTEVLLDALEGDTQLASLEQIGNDRFVTSQSIALHLDGNVPKEAGKYGVRMIPRPKPGFYTDRVYLKVPTPEAESSPPSIAAASSIISVPAIELPHGKISLDIRSHSSAGDGVLGAGHGTQFTPSFRSVEKVRLTLPQSPSSGLAIQSSTVLAARRAKRDSFLNQVGQAAVREHFKTDGSIHISGAKVVKVETSQGEISPVNGHANWFRIRLDGEAPAVGWSDALVTLANGRVCSVCMVQGFVASLHVLDDSSLSLFHRSVGANGYEAQVAIDVLASLHAGELSQDDIINMAALFRIGKHTIITLGCIAAQFYDVLRDVDSLRSMASFYALNREPVPLDIVLYGGGRISESKGRLYADIPAVPARQPRTLEEQRQRFTFQATPGFERHPIAGRIPWMRHAWGAIITANCDKSAEPWRQQALSAMAHLAPGLFTNVMLRGRHALFKVTGA